MSRATSYDPFAKSVSSNRSGSVIRNSSYNLKSSTISSNRYGSTEQLMNSYKSPMSSSYTPRASSGTARSVRAGSCTFYSGAYDSPSPTQLSRYRPPEKPSYTSTLTKYRSTDLSSTSDYSTAKYSSRSSLENSSYSGKYSSYSSSKSSPYSSRNTTSSSYRSDRDYKSMSRYEKTDSEEEDNVESTFQKLYKKYVTESEPDLTKEESLAEKVARRFESKSEAETSDDGVDEDEDTEMVFKSYERRGLRRASSASSITPRASKCSSPSKDLTPKASPMLQRKINVIPVLSSSESSADEDIPPIVVPSQQRKVIGATIKINGRPVTSSDEINNEPNTQSVRIKLKRSSIPVEEVAEQQQISEVVKTEITVESKEAPSENRKDREKSSSEESSSSRSTLNRRRRDPNRTIEQLRTSLMAEKVQNEPLKIDNDDTAQVQQEPKMRKIPIPIVLITEPSNPSTPLATTPVQTAASICLWNKRESISDEDEDEEYEDEEEYTSGEWSEDEEDEEDEEYSDVEFSVSQTFSLKDHLPFDNLYPLATSTSATSAVVSEFGASGDGDAGDNLNDLFLKQSRKEESRGRVDSLFAMPAPTFTCSVSYDGMTHDNDDDWMSDEVHSCDDDEDEEDIDDEDFRVIPIARPGSSSLGAYMSPGSLTSDEDYDGQTVGCTLKLVDRAAQKDESDESEYYDDEEVDEYSDEEYWDEEEDEEEEEEFEDEEMLEEFIDEQEYCSNEDEEFSIESNVEDEIPLEFVPDLKPMTESLVEEMIEEAIYSNLPDEQIIAIDGVEVEDYISTSNINIVPTFVRQMTENIKEEMTSRFSDRKPTTDFAKKAVIQPAKLEKVKIETVETKIAK